MPEKCSPEVGQEPALEDRFYEMLQKAQGRDPSLFLPVTPVPPTPGWRMAATPGRQRVQNQRTIVPWQRCLASVDIHLLHQA